MPKLTDTQLVVLSAAAQRDDGHALPVPKSLKARGAALAKTLEALNKKGLLEERPAAPNGASWREDADGRRLTLVIAEAGRKAIDGRPIGSTSKPPVRNKPRPKNTAPAEPKEDTPAAMPRGGTKLALVIGLLKRKSGANIDELIEVTNWQAHTVRAALTGLRKRGFDITCERKDKVTSYRAEAS